ncbi:hypothetical protein V6Z11_D05G164700 [Gossypium hirsutum]
MPTCIVVVVLNLTSYILVALPCLINPSPPLCHACFLNAHHPAQINIHKIQKRLTLMVLDTQKMEYKSSTLLPLSN